MDREIPPPRGLPGHRHRDGGRGWAALGVVVGLALAGTAAGCRREEFPADPEERARAFVERWGEAARTEWLRSPAQWSIGLDDRVAGRTAETSARAVTIRDLAAGDLAGASCRPAGSASDSKVLYRTVVETEGNPVAAFVWPDLRSAIDGHREVRTALAAARGDPASFWRALENRPALGAACVFGLPEREKCPAAAALPPRP